MSAHNLNLLRHNWPITANQCSDNLISHRDASTPQVTRNTKPMHDLHTVRLFYTRGKQHPFPQIKELFVERIGRWLYRNWLLPRCTISNRTSSEEDGVLEIKTITSTPAKLEEIQQCTIQDLYLPTSKMLCTMVGHIIQTNAPKTKESFGISERIWFWIWNGLILKRHHLVITSKVCPQMLQIINQGHMGMKKCHLKAKESLFWPGISRDIKELTANCATCIQQPKETLCPLSTPGLPWQKLGCDLDVNLLKKAETARQDLYRARLSYQTMPIDSNLPSPAKVQNQRDICTQLLCSGWLQCS